MESKPAFPFSQTPYRIMGFIILTLVIFSIYLSLNRIYQVDEVQNIYMAHILGSHQTSAYLCDASIWLAGPMAWLSRISNHSDTFFHLGRLFFLCIFWCNILLMASLAAGRLRSRKGLLAIGAAATLTPLWDYGFEIRHDNLVLLGILTLWWIYRRQPHNRRTYSAIGVGGTVIVFIAFKAFVFVLPLWLLCVALSSTTESNSRFRLGTALAGGASIMFALMYLLYRWTSLWPLLVAQFAGNSNAALHIDRFSPWIAFGRLFYQSPFLLALWLGTILHLGYLANQRDWKGVTQLDSFPEILASLGVAGILLVNPTPFPYNLVFLVPLLFISTFRFALDTFGSWDLGARASMTTLSLVIVCHGWPFVSNTWRHVEKSNERQEHLMQTAEALTAPTDPVYDATGLVPTRPSIHRCWWLHTFNIHLFGPNGPLRLRDMIMSNPPAVIMPNYRTDWLDKEDKVFVSNHFLPLANDFWVLGEHLPKGGGTFSVLRAGRYRILGIQAGQLIPAIPGVIDGTPTGDAPIWISAGKHQLSSTAQETEPVVIWVGPTLMDIPQVGSGNHLSLFVNWY